MELDHAVQAGVRLKMTVHGMVPLFEEHTVRLENRYSLEEWQSLDVTEKALMVAHRRIKISMENIQSEAQIQHAKRNSPKAGRRR